MAAKFGMNGVASRWDKNRNGPVGRWAMRHMNGSEETARGNVWDHSDEHNHIKADCVRAVMFGGKPFYETEDSLMDVIASLQGHYDEAEKLWTNYESKLATFRSMVKNDVASLDASAKRAQETVARIKSAHDKVFEILNSRDMASAIDNAERLAKALNDIAGLKSHKLVMAVVDSTAGGTAT